MPSLPPPSSRCHVLIGGAGFAGLALAVALRQALGAPFGVTVADPALGRTHEGDARASAIAASARRLFETIGAWEAVAGDAQPILDMVVTDSRLDDVARPTFLSFDGDVAPGEPFAHMVENAPLVDRSAQRRRPLASICAPARCPASRPARRVNGAFVRRRTVSAALLVAADGARSLLRERAGIDTFGWSYGQAGIVTTVAHERDHDGRAEQHFLPAGPFAILPLTGRRCSIVWTEDGTRPSGSSR